MRVKIKDICEVKNGYAFKSSNYTSSGIRVIRITNVQKGFIEDENPEFYPISYRDELKEYMLKENDLLISLTGNVGRAALLSSAFLPAALNQRVGCIRVISDNIRIKYIYYMFQSQKFENDCINSSNGIAQKNMSTEWLKEYEIEIRNTIEQDKIINIFDKLTKIISNYKQQLVFFDTLIKARFVEMFYKKNLTKIKIREVVNTKIVNIKNAFNKQDTIKYIDISSIDNSKNKIVNYTNYSIKEAPSRAQQVVQYNDILVSTVRPNLKNIAIVKDKDKNLVASTGYCVLRPNNSISEYLFYSVLSDEFTDNMTRIAKGASYPAIHDKDILDYDIMNPPFELQQQFATFVQHIDKLKFDVQKSLEKTQMLFDSLMQKYFG